MAWENPERSKNWSLTPVTEQIIHAVSPGTYKKTYICSKAAEKEKKALAIHWGTGSVWVLEFQRTAVTSENFVPLNKEGRISCSRV